MKLKKKAISCEKCIYDQLLWIGIDRLHIPDEHRPLGDYATSGLEHVLKYYLLNKKATELGLEISPDASIYAIISAIEEKETRKAVDGLSDFLPPTEGKNDEIF